MYVKSDPMARLLQVQCVQHICDSKLQGHYMSWEGKGLKEHLPEERGIPCHFLDVPAFLDRRLHSQADVRLSERENNTDKVNSSLEMTRYESEDWRILNWKGLK